MMKTAEEYANQIGAEWLELQESAGVITVLSSKGMSVEEAQRRMDALLNPASVTPRQIRRWLITNYGPGIMDQITAAMEAIEDPVHRAIAKSDWEFASAIYRNDSLLIQFAQMLGFSEEQMDRAFEEASRI